jgi:DNA-binding XRE family transcriptional regulator
MYRRLTLLVKEANKLPFYNNNMDGMGDRIKMLRESKGLTQQQLAEIVGVTRAAIAQWEASDHVDIKLQPWLKLLDALGADPHYLVYGPNRPKSGRRSGDAT